jgi:hypothetical protein
MENPRSGECERFSFFSLSARGALYGQCRAFSGSVGEEAIAKVRERLGADAGLATSIGRCSVHGRNWTHLSALDTVHMSRHHIRLFGS